MSEPKLMACPLDGCEMRWKETHVNHWKIECSQCSLEYGSGSGTDRNWIATSWNTRNTRHTRHSATGERLLKLANLVWESRWVSEDEDYMNVVGIAAEIRSGNFASLDKLPTVKQSFTVQEGE